MRIKNCKRFIRNEDGAVLVLVALMMTVLMGFAAFAIDVGFMYNERRSLQNAADAAALAGAQDLPNTGIAIITAVSIANENGLKVTQNGVTNDGDTVTVETNYNGDPKKIKVVCTRNVQHFFAGFLGVTNSNVSATAVAQNGKWDGNVLPFVNMDDNFSTKGDLIDVWESVAPGDKERIHDNVITVPTDSSIYVNILNDDDSIDGDYIYMKGGYAVATQLDTPLTNIVIEGNAVYVFSIKNNMIPNYADTITNINKFHLPMSNIVLLKCIVVDDWYSPGKTIYLEFQESYEWDPVKKTFLTVEGDLPGDAPKLVE